MAKKILPNNFTPSNIKILPKPNAPSFQDLERQRFNRWVVLGYAGASRNGSVWWCECKCGYIIQVQASSLKSGRSQSCGCLSKELSIQRSTRHGKHSSPEYGVWCAMKERCSNPNNRAYKNYGGRGIKVCKRWLNSFTNFYTDMGKRPDGMTLERKKNNEGYSPRNCKWATRSEQNNNTRANRLITFRHKTQSLTAWCKELNLNFTTTHRRLNEKRPLEQVFSLTQLRYSTLPTGAFKPHHFKEKVSP